MAEAVAVQDHHYTSTGLDSWKVGFWAFMGSECLFFGTLITTYMVYKGASVSGPFPEEILNIPLTSISTFVLLMSSTAMVLALDQMRKGNRQNTLISLAGVIVLGSIFLGFQVYEFTHFVHEGLTIQQNVFGSSFFVLTGFHGAHVTVGVIWMATLFQHEGGHGSIGFYWLIAGILTVITAVEVAIFYIEALASVLVPILLVLSTAKFAMVVMFFMHLKSDSKVFSVLFLAGLSLAVFVVVMMIVLYQFLPRFDVVGV